MHAMRLLAKWLQRNAIIGHQARVGALVRVVGALLSGGRLALTHLGRHRAGRAFVKHHIKAVDRLLGNRHLNCERDGVYRALARTVLGGVARPVILVDWADSALAHKQLILNAAVPVKGRAISIYEQIHPMRCYNNAGTHRRFLHRLHSILPEGCCPIVVTDAGFRGPWFRDVEALGWDWVGRIRNRIKRIYTQRMQSEETIRDLKSHRFGFALRYARTKRPERLEALLLVAALASFILWLLGLAACNRQWARHSEANTERRRTVLSIVFLGQELWRNHRFKVTLAELFDALKRLKLLVRQEAQHA